MTQQEVALGIGVSRQSISKWETGKASPNPRELADLCMVYGVSTDWLLTGTKTVPASHSPMVSAILSQAPPKDEECESHKR